MRTAKAIEGGLVYGLVAFLIGFALGSLRIFLVAPRLGAFAAGLVELPLIVLATALAGKSLVRRRALSVAEAGVTGLVGFVTLLAFEALLTLGLGGTGKQWLASFATPLGQLGLAGQAIFAVLPMTYASASRRRS